MPETLITGVWIGLASILGLMIGSFLNVCIYRLPAGLTIVRGHSFCPTCKHNLGALDLFPVFSYLLLGRRCRYCHEPISSRYMRIELLTGVYFGLAAALWRPGVIDLPAWLANLTGLTGWAARFEASIFLVACAALAFSALTVWAMISWDEKDVPGGLYIFILFPVALRLALQPELLLYHVAGFLLSSLAFLVVFLLKLLPVPSRRQQLQLGAGLSLIGLMSGLSAIQPVLLVMLLELLLIALRTRHGDSSGEKQASLLWRSMPLQALLIGSVLWLVF